VTSTSRFHRYCRVLALVPLAVGCKPRSLHPAGDASVSKCETRNPLRSEGDPAIPGNADADRVPVRLLESSNRFALEMYRRAVEPKKNLILSPVSMAAALSMAMEGARGETRRQIAGVLHVDSADESSSLAGLFTALTRHSHDGSELRVASLLWVQKDLAINPDFVTFLRDRFDTRLGTVDFVRTPDTARRNINSWTYEQTDGQIDEVLSAEAITPYTRLLISDAVYFRGLWEHPFKSADTIDRNFAAVTGNASVKTMSAELLVAHVAVSGARLLELPYGNGATMMIVLPDAIAGLGSIEHDVETEYSRWRTALVAARPVPGRTFAPTRLKVFLPRWRARTALQCNDVLRTLGMVLPFERGAADFARISSDPLYVERVTQAASIDVNELGSTSAAGTGISFALDSEPPEFRADHPFLYFIIDPSGLITFIGRVVDPR